MTSDQEKVVLDHLVKAWNEFCALCKTAPNHQDDIEEFKTGIHMAQMVIAHRVAKRVDPETWGNASTTT